MKVWFVVNGQAEESIAVEESIDVSDFKQVLKNKFPDDFKSIGVNELKILGLDGEIASTQLLVKSLMGNGNETVKVEFKSQTHVPVPPQQSSRYVDSLTDFLAVNMYDGCSVDDMYFVNRDDVVNKVIDSLCQSTDGARILIKAAPFSGKTSILQMVLRKVRNKYEIIFIAGSYHSRDDSAALQIKIKDSITKAQDKGKQVLVVIDDCQRLYGDDIIPGILKNLRSVHLLTAASYIIRNSDQKANDTPAVFQELIDSNEVGISLEQCLCLLQQQPFHGVITNELFECLLSQCQLGNTTPSQRYHLGVFKHFLIEFADVRRVQDGVLTADDCYDIIWAVNLHERVWMRRAFNYCAADADILKDVELKMFMRELLLPYKHLNLNDYQREISILIRATVLYKVDAEEAVALIEDSAVSFKLYFSVEIAKRFVTGIVFQPCYVSGLYIVPKSVNLFIGDFLSSISADELQLMSPNEYQWQQCCYKRIFDFDRSTVSSHCGEACCRYWCE